MDKKFNIEAIRPLMKLDIEKKWGTINREPTNEQLSNYTEFNNYIGTEYHWNSDELNRNRNDLDEIYLNYSDEYIDNVDESEELNKEEFIKDDNINRGTQSVDIDNELLNKEAHPDTNANENRLEDDEYCGVEEFEGEKFDTCKGEKIIEEGFNNPDR